ncbi:sensor histidine kinase [Chelativorans sp. M5D2P16]|uniref:sensor histidine kinase n=1 Tax=Chelativorans sp. M5D2P16 TaxID=3095678 RepID=UPI002ACAB207|nr:sensor histidine kinase [Chelativorans sp. M5D2P16]MDZ5695700.1 sensor histidine kinase [Chelativorans sp. M5D2P16]
MTTAASALPRAQSLAFRLAMAMGFILVLVVLASMVAATRFGQAASDEAFDRLLRGAALQIAERISVSEGEAQVDLPVSAFELLSLVATDRVFYRVIGPDGKTMTGYGDLPPPDEEAPNSFYNTRFKGVDVRAFKLTRQLAERTISGEVVILVAQTTRERTALANSIALRAVLIIAAAGILFLLLALLVLRVALRPLARVERAILEREANDLSPIAIPAPKEIAVLVSAINRFMGRLDRRIEAMQNFVADAAHQIRTPITALRAQAQLALEEKEPARLERLHRRLYARSVGLGRLADQLLSQALVSHRADTAEKERIDLRRVAIEAERALHAATDRTVALDLPDGPVWVEGDPVSLREAVKNLLNNAAKYGAPPVTLRVAHCGSRHAAITVHDHGDGLPEELAARIGERFTANGIGPDSAGLGLSIVASVARMHDARLTRGTCADGFSIGLEMAAA